LACASLLACSGGPGGGDDDAQVFIDATVEGGADAGDGGFGLGRVDRAGRPLVALVLVPGSQQDDYNAAGSFDPSLPVALQNALQARLVELDSLVVGDAGDAGPDPVDWPVPDAGQHPLLGMFAADTLLVDTSLPCAGDAGFAMSYLDIERELYLSGAPHSTCGGRTPNENAVDETLQLVVTGDRDGGPTVSQGVSGPTKPATTHFPYLADPN
jgi:hypothetical protein